MLGLYEDIKWGSKELGYWVKIELTYRVCCSIAKVKPDTDTLKPLYQRQNRLEGYINKKILKIPYEKINR